MSNPFSIEVGSADGYTVIRLAGYVDAYTAPDFEAAVQAEVSSGRKRLIVDCEKLSYISSAGLGVFMSFIEEVREAGGDIKITKDGNVLLKEMVHQPCHNSLLNFLSLETVQPLSYF